MSTKKTETGSRFPFRGKYTPEVIINSNIRKRLQKRQCTVLRLTRDKSKYALCWDGTKSIVQVPKEFIRKVKNR